MGQIPAKSFPPPAPFGDAQVNVLQQAQKPPLIQQGGFPSLGSMTAGQGMNTPATPTGPAIKPPTLQMPFRPTNPRSFYGQ